MRSRGARRVAAVAVVLVGLIVSGCTAPDEDSGGGGDRERPEAIDDVLPHDTLSDWVSYADAVVVLRVDRTEAVPGDDDVPQRDVDGNWVEMEPSRHRVTASVEQVLWSRPGGTPVPEGFTVVGPWQPVGARYLMPATYFSEDWGWGPIDVDAVLPFVDGQAVVPDTGDGAGIDAMGAIEGQDVAGIRQALGRAEPHPDAVEHATLDPIPRSRVD